MRIGCRKVFCYMMCISLVCLSVACNVSKKSKAASDTEHVKELCEEFQDLLGYYSLYDMDSGQSCIFDFSKKQMREKAIMFSGGKHGELSGSAQNKLSKKLFGKGVSEVEQIIGDWGASWPVLALKKLVKKSGKNYQANMILFHDDEYGGHEKEGTVKMWMTKNKKAGYGFYVKKIKLQKL